MKTEFNKFKNKPNIVLIQGSPRNVNNCPNENSKTSKIIKYVKDNISDANITIIDLKLDPNKDIIKPCKGCISTAGGYHCTYPCSCYDETNDKMFSEKIYDKLEKSDAFIIFTPIHWYAATSQVKALFDRLVCINLTLTKEQSKELFNDDIKNSKLTSTAEQDKIFDDLLKNHWEGKLAGFYAFGDNGADDYDNKDIPKTHSKYDDKMTPKDMIMPYVWQMRYSGIDVQDDFIEAYFIDDKIPYSEQNENFKNDKYQFMYDKALTLTKKIIKKISK